MNFKPGGEPWIPSAVFICLTACLKIKILQQIIIRLLGHIAEFDLPTDPVGTLFMLFFLKRKIKDCAFEFSTERIVKKVILHSSARSTGKMPCTLPRVGVA